MTVSAHPHRVLGRYALFDEIAFGGMASVHFGRLIGPVGFSRTVAIKRLHSHLARDPEFAAGFVDEGRLAARIRHPNVVPIVEILADDGELSLVMDYIEGDSLAKLLSHAIAEGAELPLPIVSAIGCGSLLGLHAAHEAKSEQGEPLHIVHRDVSPQNILVGVDGVPRIVDFGVAKAAMRLQTTMDGQVKGKVSYMAPEQIKLGEVTRRTDVYAMGVVLWEMLTRMRLFKSDNQAHLMTQVLEGAVRPASAVRKDVPPELDAVIARALSARASERYATAREMAVDLARAVPPAEPSAVGDWLLALNPPGLRARHEVLSRIERLDVEHLGDEALRTQTASLFTKPRSANDDVPTRAESAPLGPRPPGPDDTTQAVTDYDSFPRRRPSRSRRPLFLALLGTLALAASALVLVPPTGPTGARFSPNARFRDISFRPLRALLTDRVGLQAERAHILGERLRPRVEILPEPAPAAAKNPPRPSAKPRPKPEACPKFYVDAQGISRVNRKCWP